MTAPSQPLPGPTVAIVVPGGRHARAPEVGAPPGPTAVVPSPRKPRIQGPVPIAVRPLTPPPPPVSPHWPVRPRRTGPPPAGLATGSMPGLYGPMPASGRTDRLAGAALVVGLIAVPGVLVTVGGTLLLAIVAICLGVVGLGRISRTGDRGRGVAWAGIAVGSGLVLMYAVLIAATVLGALS